MATFKIMLDPRTPEKQNGTKAIVLRVTDKGKRNYIPLGLSVLPKNWNSAESKFKRAHDPLDYQELNHNLKLNILSCDKIVSDFGVKQIPFSFDHFKSKFLVPKDIPSVFEFFDTRIEIMKTRKEIGNAKVYFHTKNALIRYGKKTSLSFHEITPSFLEDMESAMMKKGLAGNTIHHYMRHIKALYNKAIENRYVNHEINPFFNEYTRQGYRFGHQKKATPKIALSKADLVKIINYQPVALSLEEDTKLLFLFSFYCWGMNINDIAKLRWDNNITSTYIEYFRTKTRNKKKFRIPIIEPIKDILSVCHDYSPKGYVFTILNDSITDPEKQYSRIANATRRFNSVLKKIAKELKIETPLTTNVARHSCATLLKKEGQNLSVIKEIMGHTTEITTQIYLDEFENEILAKAGELLDMG